MALICLFTVRVTPFFYILSFSQESTNKNCVDGQEQVESEFATVVAAKTEPQCAPYTQGKDSCVLIKDVAELGMWKNAPGGNAIPIAGRTRKKKGEWWSAADWVRRDRVFGQRVPWQVVLRS